MKESGKARKNRVVAELRLSNEVETMAAEALGDPKRNVLFEKLNKMNEAHGEIERKAKLLEAHQYTKMRNQSVFRKHIMVVSLLLILYITGLAIFNLLKKEETKEPVYQDEKTEIFHEQDLTEQMIDVHYKIDQLKLKKKQIADYVKWEKLQ